MRLLALLGLIGLAAPASAADLDAAKRAFERAEQDFARGDFAAALVGYSAAHEHSGFPALLFNIGQCHRNLGDYERAVFFLQRYLKEAPNIDDRGRVVALVRTLETLAHRRHRLLREAPTRTATIAAPPPGEIPATALVSAPASVRGDAPPLYATWWFWTIAGFALAAGVSTAVVLGTRPPEGGLGTIDVRDLTR